MRTFRWLLTEGRVEWLKDNLAPVDTSHDVTAKHRDNNSIIDHFATHADPSVKKSYTQWILKQYGAGHFRQEDSSRVKGVIQKFEAHRDDLPHKDINKFNYPDLEDHIDKLENAGATPKISKNAQEREIKNAGATKIFSKDGVTVHQLHTHEAAKLYGAGTKWCTTQTNPTHFNNYSSRGPLYVVQLKGPQAKGDVEKYQIQFESHQVMDAKDRPTDLKDAVERFPALKEVPQFQGKRLALTKEENIPKHASDLLKNDFKGAGSHPYFKEEDFEAAYHNVDKTSYTHAWEKDSAKNTILEGGRFSNKFMSSIMNQPEAKDQWSDPRYYLARNPNTSDEHLRMLASTKYGRIGLGYRDKLPDDIRDTVVSHAMHNYDSNRWQLGMFLGKSYLSDRHVDQLVNHSNAKHRSIAAEYHWDRMDHDQRAKLISDESSDVRKTVFDHADLSPEMQHVLYHSSNHEVRAHMAQSDKTTPTLHKTMFNERSTPVLMAYAREHGSKMKREEVQSVIARTGQIPVVFAKSRHLTPSQVEVLVTANNAYVRELAASRADLPEEHMHVLSHDANFSVLTKLARHKKLPQQLIPRLIARGNGYVHNALLKRTDLTREHLELMSKVKVKKTVAQAKERLAKLSGDGSS